MNTTRKLLVTSLSLAGALTATTAHAINLGASVGVYDENSGNLNTVDVNATGAASFASVVAAAFAADLGGVLNFDAIGTPSGGQTGTTHSTQYGVTAGSVLNFTTSTSTQFVSTGSFGPISGINGFTQNGESTNGLLYTFNEDGAGAVAGAPLLNEIGFTLLSRNNAAYPLDVLATATYTDGGFDAVTSSLSNVTGGADTFLGFSAPLGQGIATLNLQSFAAGTTTAVNARIGIDDLGFVTTAVPEPASLAVLGAGGLLVLGRRRPQR